MTTHRVGPAALMLVVTLGLSLAAPPAAAVELVDLEGATHRLDDYRGKWVVINYWATWCPPCLEEIPELVQLHEERKDRDAVVIGINRESISTARLREFVDEFFVTYPVVAAGPGRESPFGSLPGLPVTFLVSPGGNVVARQLGGVTKAQIERFIANWDVEKAGHSPDNRR